MLSSVPRRPLYTAFQKHLQCKIPTYEPGSRRLFTAAILYVYNFNNFVAMCKVLLGILHWKTKRCDYFFWGLASTPSQISPNISSATMCLFWHFSFPRTDPVVHYLRHHFVCWCLVQECTIKIFSVKHTSEFTAQLMVYKNNGYLIYLLTAIWLTPSGSNTVHIYTQTIHRTTQLIWEECRPCPIFASYTLYIDILCSVALIILFHTTNRPAFHLTCVKKTEKHQPCY